MEQEYILEREAKEKQKKKRKWLKWLILGIIFFFGLVMLKLLLEISTLLIALLDAVIYSPVVSNLMGGYGFLGNNF